MGKVLQFKRPEPKPRGASVFHRFVDLVSVGDLKAASFCLVDLMGLSYDQAELSTIHFARIYESNLQFRDKVMALTKLMDTNDPNENLMLIHSCFGLQITEAIEALHHMRQNAS